jgi:hypothetical protein
LTSYNEEDIRKASRKLIFFVYDRDMITEERCSFGLMTSDVTPGRRHLKIKSKAEFILCLLWRKDDLRSVQLSRYDQ